MPLTPGTRLGPFEVDGFVGAGGMAEVYRAHDVRLGREVAIKILPDLLAADPDALKRFEREARTASSLNHPHIVTIHGIGEAYVDGRLLHFMAMELILGNTLRERLVTDQRDPLLLHLANVADGLAKAHDAGVIHRDLKPENVMLSEDGFAKIVDFGLAKQLPMELTQPSAEHVTGEGYALGTVGYMAPEQVRGQLDIDHRADVFAFGCMLYEVVARRNPFEDSSPIETMHRILNFDPPPLPNAYIDSIVRRCLEKNPQHRYASMREVARDVRTAITATAMKPVPPPGRRSFLRHFSPRVTSRGVAIVAVAAAVAAGSAFFAIRHTPTVAIDSIAVLPFANMTGKAEADFLERIAEDAARDLGRIPTLRVIASSSTVHYGHDADPRKAARDLNVDAVLVGQLRTTSQTLLLDAELVRADGTTLWSNQYVRSLASVPGLEDELVADLCAELGLKRPRRRPATRSPEAYQAYLRGRHEMQQQTAPAFKKAIEHFNRAIALDPEFALAYAWLANAHGRQAVFRVVPARVGIRQQRAEALKAISLDDSLPDAHWNLALIASFNGDHAEYDRHEARVLALDPNFAPAYIERANRLLVQKRFDEANAAFAKALELDPMSPLLQSSYAMHLHLVRRHEQAVPLLLNLTEQFPDYANAYPFLAIVYTHLGRHEDALAAIAQATPGSNPNLPLWTALVLARAGRTNEARAIVDQADERAKVRFVATYYRAQVRAALGERDAAFSLLEQGVRDDEWMPWLWYDPGFDPLRSDPRFAALVEKQRQKKRVLKP
ncbi:MAG TPA: protein kinase [Thermoanaerobaculia bacterium]|nr:protein kinase [Thermoanaerobaculia bacterium]